MNVPPTSIPKTLKFLEIEVSCFIRHYQCIIYRINFWGNELTLHETKTKQVRERHDVDMGDVCVPHFGVHLEAKDFAEVKKRIEASEIDYFDNPYRRFVGSKFEQETFFVEDPNGNVLEIKTMSNPEILFEVAS